MANQWYKLNNIGKLYASTANMKPPKVFRYSAYLKEDIKEEILQEALNKTLEVYPSFKVNLRKGFFWYYLEETNKNIKVSEENLPVCFKLYNTSEDFLIRITYYKKRINFEASHIISDGRGGVEFFKLLVSNYIAILNNLDIPKTNSEGTLIEKTEDSFRKYYEKGKLEKETKTKPYKYKSRKFRNQTQFLECYVSTKQVLDLAHKYNATLAVFLTAVTIYSFKDYIKAADFDKYIKIAVPVDLRAFFKSNSLNNFFGVVNIEYKFKSNKDSLEEIIEEVKKQFKEKITEENLKKRADKMVMLEKLWAYRWFPIIFKDFVLNIAKSINASNSSTNFSNIGKIDFGKEINPYIDKISAMMSSESFQFISCSFEDNLCITISNAYVHNDIIKNFCRFFVENGINMQINCNEIEE